MTNTEPDVVRELRERLAQLQNGSIAGPPGADDRAEPGSAPPPGPNSAFDSVSAGAPTEKPAAVDGESPDPEEEQLARTICVRLLADMARPRANLEQKLLRRGISQATVDRVLDRFTELGLIDDKAYAEAYVRTKHRERGLARPALAAELRRKGVDAEIADVALDEVDSSSEESRATELIAKRAPAAAAAGREAARRRLLALLDRRGYSAELSIRVVDDALAGLPREAAE